MALNLEALRALGSLSPLPPSGLPDMVQGRTCHIDGDMLAYFCAGGAEMPKDASRRALINRVRNLRELSGSSDAVIHITARGSNKGYRNWLASKGPKAYQANRAGASKPKNWEFLRLLMEENGGIKTGVPCKKISNAEADDAMARACYGTGNVLATRDKDLRMVTGCWHITWMNFEMIEVPKDAFEVLDSEGLIYGHKWFWMQMLMGDTVDNVAGLPKLCGKNVGEKAAAKYLAGCTNDAEAFSRVAALYAGEYGERWAREFCIQAGLLWMRRAVGSTFAFIPELLNPCPSVINTTGLLLLAVQEAADVLHEEFQDE